MLSFFFIGPSLLFAAAIFGISEIDGRKVFESQTKPNNTAAIKRDWLKYKAKYGKVYDDAAEDDKRFQIWSAQHIEHKALRKTKGYKKSFVNSDGQAFQYTGAGGPNSLSDWTADELEFLSGTVPTPDDEFNALKDLDPPLGFSGDDDSPLPEFVDWRQRGAVTPVKNQGHCQSCWAFASAAVLESQIMIVDNVLDSLSPQNIMDCQAGWRGCKVGHYVDKALEKSLKDGVQSLAAYPYNSPVQKNEECKLKSENLLQGLTDEVKVLKVPRGDEQELKRVVARYGPVAVAIHSNTDSFRKYTKAVNRIVEKQPELCTISDGVYKNEPQCSKAVDHAVTLIGYGTDELTKEEYWLIKNSYGEGWGDGGYMRLARNANNYCGIASQATYVILNPPPGEAGAPVPSPCDGKDCGCTPTGLCWTLIDNIDSAWCYTNALTTSKDSVISRPEVCDSNDDCSDLATCTGCHIKDGLHICPKRVQGYNVSPGDCKPSGNAIRVNCGQDVEHCAAECTNNAQCNGFIYSNDPDHPMNDCEDTLCVLKTETCTAVELYANEKPGLFWYQKKA